MLSGSGDSSTSAASSAERNVGSSRRTFGLASSAAGFTSLCPFCFIQRQNARTLAIFRAHHQRIEELRTEVTHQILGFSSIWVPVALQQRLVDATVPSRDLHPASFAVLMPVYGTLDDFKPEIRRWRDRQRARKAAVGKS